jgi:hypothetical protein
MSGQLAGRADDANGNSARERVQTTARVYTTGTVLRPGCHIVQHSCGVRPFLARLDGSAVPACASTRPAEDNNTKSYRLTRPLGVYIFGLEPRAPRPEIYHL